jgi:hypothetical protein
MFMSDQNKRLKKIDSVLKDAGLDDSVAFPFILLFVCWFFTILLESIKIPLIIFGIAMMFWFAYCSFIKKD